MPPSPGSVPVSLLSSDFSFLPVNTLGFGKKPLSVQLTRKEKGHYVLQGKRIREHFEVRIYKPVRSLLFAEINRLLHSLLK